MTTLDFKSWSQDKAPWEYWHAGLVPDDYAQQQRQHYLERLDNRQLTLGHVVWHVTNRCNLLCHHCGVAGGERKYSEISLDDFARALGPMMRLGLKYVTLSGGEPLLRKELFDIIAVLKICKLKVGMVSNGHNFRHFETQFLEHAPDTLSISIDGLEKNHNQIRAHSGSFQQTLEALKLAKTWGIHIVNVNTCVSPQNLSEMSELRDLIFDLGVDHWILRPITSSGRAEDADYALNQEQLKDLLHFSKASLEAGYDLTLGGTGFLGPWDSLIYSYPHFPHSGWNSFYILPNGDIKGFNEDGLPVEGNILEDDIEKLWYSGFESYRHPELPLDCLQCDYFQRCGGGNIAEAHTGLRCAKPLFGSMT